MIGKLLDLIDYALSLLPQSPFQSYAASIRLSDGVGWLNWFFPVGRCMTVVQAWLGAILLYYFATIILRWVKAIQ